MKNVTFDVVINGRPVRQYAHEGKTFIEARDGSEYTVTVKNNNPFRVLVVSSVDGLDVLTGKPASKDGRGYIVNAYSDLKIKGFRKSMDEIGAFKFTKKESSYAAGKGEGANVGVIAFAVFKEQLFTIQDESSSFITTWRGPRHSDISTKNAPMYTGYFSTTTLRCVLDSAIPSATYCCSTTSMPQETFQAGTTWGAKVKDKVVEAEFIKESDTPYVSHSIYYDFKGGLEAMGIKLVPEKSINLPDGFPADNKFAEPPEGWVS